MSSRVAFLGLILAQAAHSIEEYAFGLYDVLAPAREISRLVSGNLPAGFAAVNASVVTLGVWSYLARVRPRHPSWKIWAWGWAGVEATNAVGHALLAAGQGGYFPGLATAPLLLAFAGLLAVSLARPSDLERA